MHDLPVIADPIISPAESMDVCVGKAGKRSGHVLQIRGRHSMRRPRIVAGIRRDPHRNAGPGNFHDATLELPIVTRRVDQISPWRQVDRLEFVVFCAIAITCPISNMSLDSASLESANLRALWLFSLHARDRISTPFFNRASSARALTARTASVSCICRGLKAQTAAMCRGWHADVL